MEGSRNMVKNAKTNEEFDAAVASGRVLGDFWATWCGPCMMMGERIEKEIVPSMPWLDIVKVNVDEAPELAARFGVMSIPFLACYVDGAKKADFTGVTPAEEIAAAFAQK